MAEPRDTIVVKAVVGLLVVTFALSAVQASAVALYVSGPDAISRLERNVRATSATIGLSEPSGSHGNQKY